jgi:hypothetical protein
MAEHPLPLPMEIAHAPPHKVIFAVESCQSLPYILQSVQEFLAIEGVPAGSRPAQPAALLPRPGKEVSELWKSTKVPFQADRSNPSVHGPPQNQVVPPAPGMIESGVSSKLICSGQSYMVGVFFNLCCFYV